jgi:hypothetical protein
MPKNGYLSAGSLDSEVSGVEKGNEGDVHTHLRVKVYLKERVSLGSIP